VQQEGTVPGAGARCSEHFADNAAAQGTTGNKAWCEVDTAKYIETTVLPAAGWTATPEQPYSLHPTLTMLPPPFPPPPTKPAVVPLGPAPGGTNSNINGSSTLEAPSGSGAAGARAGVLLGVVIVAGCLMFA
jgi:hypothetical protein